MAGSYDIVIDQGADLIRTFTVTDANGVAVTYAGFTARMMVRKKFEDAALLTLTTGNGITLGALGVVSVAASAATMAATPPGSYLYDIMLTSAGGTTTKFMAGKLVVVPSVTR